MTISLKHSYVSTQIDAGDSSVVQPSDWNDEHVLQQATARLLGRITAGTGATEELTKADVLTFLNVEDGADVTDTTNVTAAGALMDSEVASLAAIKDVILSSGLTISASYETADETKLDFISVTQAVDLDQMETDIAALSDGMTYEGDWDASAGTFPGGGTATKGSFYYVSVAGTVDSVEFAVGDNLVATVDNASTSTFAANWSKHDQTDAVTAVVGLTGSVSKAGLLSALNVEDGADVTDATNVDAAGAVMNTDSTTAAMSFVIDEDNMVSDSDTKVPTQQSVKAYVDTTAVLDSEVDADIKTLALPANTTISAFGATLIDDATAAAARTTLGVDAAGTDNSTDVTLAGTGTYLSLAGQAITVDPITESDIADLQSYLLNITGEVLSDLSDVTITSIAAGELLKWNGSAWINNTIAEAGLATAAQGSTADSALQNVVEDTTPQLGGSLDVNGNKIVSTANGDIDIEPNGTGNVIIGNFTFDADQTVGAGQDNYVFTYDNATGLISLEASAGGGGGTEFADDVFRIQDNADATKELAFQISGITTATTRTLTPPNYDGTIATLAGTETFTNKTFDANGTGNSLSNVDVADLAAGTDGELITWDASGNPTTVPVGTATHVLTSNGVGAAPTFQASTGGSAPEYKVKTADTTHTSDTTLTDDPHLVGWTVAANSIYRLTLILHTNTPSNTPDMKIALTGPTGFTAYGSQHGAGNPLNDYTTAQSVNLNGDDSTTLEIIIDTAGTAGTLDLQIAQNTSSTDVLTIKEDSAGILELLS